MPRPCLGRMSGAERTSERTLHASIVPHRIAASRTAKQQSARARAVAELCQSQRAADSRVARAQRAPEQQTAPARAPESVREPESAERIESVPEQRVPEQS